MPEKRVVGLQGLIFAAFAMVLAACGTDAGSADNVGKAAAPTASSSVEVLGEITAALNGEQRTWYVTREYKAGRWITESDQSFLGTGTVFFSGHVSKDNATNPIDLLVITASVNDSGDGATVQSAKIMFAGQELWKGRYGSEYGGEAVVTFDTISNSGGETRLRGRFSGKLPYKDNSSADPDVSNIVTLEKGEFDVNLILSE
jgi:hypothetical protein